MHCSAVRSLCSIDLNDCTPAAPSRSIYAASWRKGRAEIGTPPNRVSLSPRRSAFLKTSEASSSNSERRACRIGPSTTE